jgi:hypothetical protein
MHKQSFRYNFRRAHLEAWFWIAALITLAFTNPEKTGHASLCLAKNMDLGFCPGCGLGHSIAWLFKGKVLSSFHAHPFGIPAVIILIYRAYSLLADDISIKPLNLSKLWKTSSN